MLAALATLALAAALASSQAELLGITEQVALESISPSSGATKPIGGPVSYELQAQGLSTVDSATGTYFLLGFNSSSTRANLVGINIASGMVTTDIAMPFAESAFVGVGQSIDVDPTDGNIFAGGRMETHGPHVIGKIDIKSGKFTPIASLNATFLPVLGAATAFIPNTRQLFVQLGTASAIDIFGVNVETGKITKIPQDPEEGRVLTTMALDAKTRSLIGLGVKPSNGTLERTLVRLDPVSHSYTTVGDIPAWLVESGGESALDTFSRTLYWIGQPTGAKPTDPFHLVGLNADTGAVVSSPLLVLRLRPATCCRPCPDAQRPARRIVPT
ncbi:hypothetical protein FNF27_08359 [Cafeteria roenbergensis]|nr:hypothetical protein FNF27_08359 [Cafeteria roenbergensis]